ncbi:hypothetical protein H0H93_012050, partial [Arthromyces matolae]
RLSLAQKYGVLEFLRPAYIDLVDRDEPLSDMEVTALGSKITAQICRVREYRIANMPHSRDYSVQEEVELHFKEQLDSAASASAIQRVLISQKENVKEWLESALVDVARKHQLTNDDVGALGKDMILKLYRVGEAVCATTWSEKPVAICAARVATEFIDEIVAVRAQVKKFRGTDDASEIIGMRLKSGLEEEAIQVPLPSNGWAVSESPRPTRSELIYDAIQVPLPSNGWAVSPRPTRSELIYDEAEPVSVTKSSGGAKKKISRR